MSLPNSRFLWTARVCRRLLEKSAFVVAGCVSQRPLGRLTWRSNSRYIHCRYISTPLRRLDWWVNQGAGRTPWGIIFRIYRDYLHVFADLARVYGMGLAHNADHRPTQSVCISTRSTIWFRRLLVKGSFDLPALITAVAACYFTSNISYLDAQALVLAFGGSALNMRA